MEREEGINMVILDLPFLWVKVPFNNPQLPFG